MVFDTIRPKLHELQSQYVAPGHVILRFVALHEPHVPAYGSCMLHCMACTVVDRADIIINTDSFFIILPFCCMKQKPPDSGGREVRKINQ